MVSSSSIASSCCVGQAAYLPLHWISFAVVLLLEVLRDACLAEIGTGVKPGPGPYRRHVGGRVEIGGLREGATVGERCEFFRVPLVHPAKAAELALDPIVVAMVIGVAGDEAVAAHVVIRLHALDDMYGERDACQPGSTGQLVGDIELGGGRVLDTRFGAQVIGHLYQQVGLLAAHQVNIAHRPARVAWQRGRPGQAGGAVSEQVKSGGRRDAVHGGELAQNAPIAPGVAGLVEV